MKNVIYLIVLVIIFSCNKEQKITSDVEVINLKKHSKLFKEWINFYSNYSISIKDFIFFQEEKIQYKRYKIKKGLVLVDKKYEAFYIYSPDKSKIIDLISYNYSLIKGKNNKLFLEQKEPDNEVFVIDLKNSTIQTIIFDGYATIFEDAYWVNNDQIFVVGKHYDSVEKNNTLIIWYVDLNKNTIQSYDCKYKLKDMNYHYLNVFIKNHIR